MSAAGGMAYYVNPEGQRLRKAGSAGTTYFAPDTSGALLAESTGSAWIDYVWLNGRLIGRVVNGQLEAIHDDQLGRPIAVTNISGTVVWSALNWPFVSSVSLSNTAPLNLGLPGQYYDSEAGLWNNGFRDYEADLGRYVESDPIGLVGGVNTYTYANGNPLSYIDPIGLNPGDPFPTANAAAIDALVYLYPITFSTSTEYAGVIYKSGNSYYATTPEPGNSHLSAVFSPSQQGQYQNAGGTPVGMYHTHPYVASDRFGIEFPGNRLTTSYDTNCFSGGDTKIANYYSSQFDKPGAPSPFTSFLGTPEMIRIYTPSTGTFGQISYPW